MARKSQPVVFISAAEPSGDLHGASLIAAVRRRRPDMRFVGLAGPRMQHAGCQALVDLTSDSVMLMGAASRIHQGLSLLSRLDRYLAAQPVVAAVLIDSPLLHLPLARRVRARNVPVFYYIAPQVWAWAQYRVAKIRRRVDRLAVILPFEEPYFREHRVPAVYVGHPLFDSSVVRPPDASRVAALYQCGQPRLALLPGSRPHVVREILPGQLEVAAAAARHFPTLGVIISAASSRARAEIAPILRASGVRGAVVDEQTPEIIAAADVVLVASGTATLVVARYRKPMVVMYNASRWAYELIGRHLIHTRHFSLVNLLAGRELVPEFMPYFRSTEPIVRAVLGLLDSAERREKMSCELDALISPLARPGASDRAAHELLDLIDTRPGRPVPSGSRHVIW